MATATSDTLGVTSISTEDAFPSTSEFIVPPDFQTLYPAGPPAPEGTIAENQGATTNPTKTEALGIGVEGEVVAWEGHYSLRNFLGRFVGLLALGAGWAYMAYEVWDGAYPNLRVLRNITGVVWVGLAALLLYRVLIARFGHAYRLTNRRLFISTGVFTRRRDQIELLRVQDVYVKQAIGSRLTNVGTIVVVSTEPSFPTMYLVGVADPHRVMDLVWHHARGERDRRSVKVDRI